MTVALDPRHIGALKDRLQAALAEITRAIVPSPAAQDRITRGEMLIREVVAELEWLDRAIAAQPAPRAEARDGAPHASPLGCDQHSAGGGFGRHHQSIPQP